MNKYEKKYKEILKKQEDKKHTPLAKVIRSFCSECMGFNENEIKGCTAKGQCVLYPYRMGRNPFTTRKGNKNAFGLGTGEKE